MPERNEAPFVIARTFDAPRETQTLEKLDEFVAEISI